MLSLWVALGLVGGLGALARFGLDAWVDDSIGGELPWGTFVINISGAFALGFLTALHLTGSTMLIAGTAALGSFTTFSTWILESHRLGENGELVALAVNLVGTMLAGLAAVTLGWFAGSAL